MPHVSILQKSKNSKKKKSFLILDRYEIIFFNRSLYTLVTAFHVWSPKTFQVMHLKIQKQKEGVKYRVPLIGICMSLPPNVQNV